METQTQTQKQHNTTQLEKLNTNSNYLCRQSSSRWTPTTEQIKLLKELYYINGVRSPTADQIQAICSRLRRYGKIEGKNVFYWFQNHKARERQKKRLIPTNTNTTTAGSNEIAKFPYIRNNITHLSNYPGVACSSSSIADFGCGAVTMENKFQDCSISGSYYGSPTFSTYAYSNFNGKISTLEEEEEDHYEKETLPLFPMNNEDDHHLNRVYNFPSTGYYTGGNNNGGGASLELSLNSYGYGCYSANYNY